MYIHSNHEQAPNYEVIDLDTKKPIKGVKWANDENGKYERYVFNKDGSLKTENNDVVTEIKIGNIKLVRKSKEE